MIFGVAMMKNEEDVAYHTVRHMIGQGVTHFVIAGNLSTDRMRAAVTDAIAESRNVVGLIFEDANAAYYQSEKMTGLARFAGDDHAFHGGYATHASESSWSARYHSAFTCAAWKTSIHTLTSHVIAPRARNRRMLARLRSMNSATKARLSMMKPPRKFHRTDSASCSRLYAS